MILSIIAGLGKKNEIGKNNALLWHVPADLKHFKETTSGHTVIMGRKTFESIGKPLPNRRNIIVTRDKNYWKEGIEVANSIDEALRIVSLEHGKNFEENQDEVETFILGGGEIYKETIDRADKLYITKINQAFDADTFFPVIDESKWQKTSEEKHDPDEKNIYPYAFLVFERK